MSSPTSKAPRRAGSRRGRRPLSLQRVASPNGLERLEGRTLLAALVEVDPAVADKIGGDLAYLFADAIAASTVPSTPTAGPALLSATAPALPEGSDRPNAAILQ